MANEKRLIDANAFKSFLCKCCNILRSDEPCEPNDCNVWAVIDEQPTVDAVEVVHGRWDIKVDEYDCEFAVCSVCGAEFYDANGEDTIDITFDYCPNCGAKMDGERKDDE